MRNIYKLSRVAATFSMLGALVSSPLAVAEESFVILDILPLKSGVKVEEAHAYFERVEPILEQYGLSRTDHALEVAAVPRGSVKAQVVNLWESDDPMKGMQAVLNDPYYKENIVPLRDRIFDMRNATVIITKRQTGEAE